MRLFHKYREYRTIIFILLIAFLTLLFNLNKPFIGHHDWNGAFWGTIVRNYLANISKIIGFSNWQNIDNVSSGEFIFFHHYTPLMPILFTVSSFIFGLSEMSMRIVTVFFSLLMLLYTYKIGKFLYSAKIGLFAVLFMMVTPMFLYYGKLPDHEPMLTSLCTVTFYYYITLNNNRHRNYFLFFFFLVLALLESWGGFFFLFFLIIHAIFSKHMKPPFIILMMITGLLVIFFHFSLIMIIHGRDTLLDFFRYGMLRLGMDKIDTHAVKFNLYQYIITEARYTVIFYTRLLTGLSLLWIGRLILILIFKKRLSFSDAMLIILFFYGFFFIVLFKNLAFIHDYKLYLILPFVGLSSARIVEIILSRLNFLIKKNFSKINWHFISNLLIFLLISSIAWERLEFLKTLINSSFDKPGYELGSYIRLKTDPKEKILINSEEFDSFYGVFIRYYANRKILAKDLTFTDFQTNIRKYQEYRYIILIDGRPADNNLKKFFKENYKVDKVDSYFFIDLHNPKNKSSCTPSRIRTGGLHVENVSS